MLTTMDNEIDCLLLSLVVLEKDNADNSGQ